MMIKRLFPVTVFVAMVLAGTINADVVSYTVGDWGPVSYPGSLDPDVVDVIPSTAPHIVDGQGYPGDSLQLVGSDDLLNLSLGNIGELDLGTLYWTMNWTYAGADTNGTNDDVDWLQLTLPVDLSFVMDIGGVQHTLHQTGLLEVNWDTDYLTLYGGSTTSFLVDGFQVDVTPIAVVRTEGSYWGTPPWPQTPIDLSAHFEVSQAPVVPVPAPIILVGLGMAAVAGRRLHKRT